MPDTYPKGSTLGPLCLSFPDDAGDSGGRRPTDVPSRNNVIAKSRGKFSATRLSVSSVRNITVKPHAIYKRKTGLSVIWYSAWPFDCGYSHREPQMTSHSIGLLMKLGQIGNILSACYLYHTLHKQKYFLLSLSRWTFQSWLKKTIFTQKTPNRAQILY